jgi:hypothetical protein
MAWMYAGTSVRKVREKRRAHIRRQRPEPVAALKLPLARERIARFPTAACEERAAPRAAPRRPVVMLQPITIKPLQLFVLRESACDYLECRSSGRRCVAAGERPVQLDHQIAYCLGARHGQCGIYRARAGRQAAPLRRLAYAAVVIIMVGLLALAVMQAMGAGRTLEMGRTLGLS